MAGSFASRENGKEEETSLCEMGVSRIAEVASGKEVESSALGVENTLDEANIGRLVSWHLQAWAVGRTGVVAVAVSRIPLSRGSIVVVGSLVQTWPVLVWYGKSMDGGERK